MFTSLEKGEKVALKEVGLFSDGSAVREVGKETFRLCQGAILPLSLNGGVVIFESRRE
jgi:threonine dehydratase